MTIPVTDYFRILVVGTQYGDTVAGIIEDHLDFRTTVCSDEDAVSAIRNGADLGAIVTSRTAAEAVVKARADRGLRMPIFMLTSKHESFMRRGCAPPSRLMRRR
jgi:ornithine decarboxylase